MRSAHLSILSIFALCLAACPAADDDDPVADTSDGSASDPDTSGGDASTGDDPFADCDRGVLEADIMGADQMGNPIPLVWMGPGVDPMTGMLVDDGSTYVVSSTYLAMKPDPAAQQAFGEVTPPIVPELFGNPGVVAFQLGSSNACASARTLTVWRDEAAMMAFVMSDAHATAAARIGEISRGSSVVTHWTGATVAEIDWDIAVEHVAADAGPFY